MEIVEKPFLVKVDLLSPGSTRTALEMRHNDKNELTLSVLANGNPVNLQDLGVVTTFLLVTRQDSQVISVDGNVNADGTASYTLNGSALADDGMVEAVAKFYDVNENCISSANIVFKALVDPATGNIGQQENEKTLIELVLFQAPDIIQQAIDATEAAEAKTLELETVVTENTITWLNEPVQTMAELPAASSNLGVAAVVLEPDAQGRYKTVRSDGTTWQTIEAFTPTQYNNLTKQLDETDARIDNIIAQSGTSSTEVVDSRQSAVKGKTFTVLDNRLEEQENDTYFPVKNEVTNADFSNGTTGYVASNSILSANSNILTIAGNGNSFAAVAYQNTTKAWTPNKKVYVKFKFRLIDAGSTVAVVKIGGSTGGTTQHTNTFNNPVQNQWYEIKAIESVGNKTGNLQLWFQHNYADAPTASGKRMEVDKLFTLDLEATFGVGNEPTVEEMERILAFYPESRFDGTVNLAENKKMLKFLLNEIRGKANKTQEAWITPTLLNGATGTIQFRKNQFGSIEFLGRVSVATNNTDYFVLPVGYRPDDNLNLYLTATDATQASIAIFTTGAVRNITGANKTFSLSSLSFRKI